MGHEPIPGDDAGDAGLPDSTVTPGFDASPEAEAGPTYRCSDDLHDVLDSDGKFLTKCPDDQGCDPSKGACVPACDAAIANHSTIGCDYYAIQPDQSHPDMQNRCFVAMVVNPWTTPVTLAVDIGGTALDVSKVAQLPVGTGDALTYEPLPGGALAPGQVAILFLSGYDLGCGPNPPPIVRPNVAGTDLGDSFHITATRPVIAYDFYGYHPFFQIASATLLYPTSAWGTNYIGVDPYARPVSDVLGGIAVPATLQIAAHEDTTVKVVPTYGVDEGFDYPGAPANVATTYSLKQGEVLQLASNKSMNGTIIESSKPVGVWSTSSFLFIPYDQPPGDSAHQQLPPVQAAGNEYVAVRYANRDPDAGAEEAPPWRIMGYVDGTKLTYDPAPPTGAPTEIKAGELKEFSAAGPFTVKSQDNDHPFYVSGHMTKGIQMPDNSFRGDPEFVNLVPGTQFLNSYTFFATPLWSYTDLVVVRPKAGDGTFKDVTLDCAGKLTGWTPVGSAGVYEYTRIDLNRDGVGQNGCDTGVHTMKSDAPFGLTVWGWSWSDSYAYPAGVRASAVNSVKIPPIPR